MTRDGVDHVAPDRHGWLPIHLIPLATGWWAAGTRTLDCVAEPMVIEGITTHGHIVVARYSADGQYNDRWVSEVGDIVYRLTHGRPHPGRRVSWIRRRPV